MISYDFDMEYITGRSLTYLAGTDEAGRGPLAGPVVAAACILKPGVQIEGLDDSKKLTEKKREKLFDIIKENCLSYGIAMCTPAEIDRYNILNASLLAMKRAVEMLSVTPDLLLVDGNKCKGFDCPAEAVVKGDGKSQSIAAASVLAKVTRDRMCLELHEKYPEYNFKKHKGYPTLEHRLAVFEYGPCPEHRRTFLSFLEKDHDNLAALLEKKNSPEE